MKFRHALAGRRLALANRLPSASSSTLGGPATDHGQSSTLRMSARVQRREGFTLARTPRGQFASADVLLLLWLPPSSSRRLAAECTDERPEYRSAGRVHSCVGQE